MDWKKAIGFGILIWLIMFALVSALLGWYNSYLWLRIVMAVVAGVISWFLVKNTKPSSIGIALGYGVVFVVVCVILDALIRVRFNPNILASKSLWLGNILILLAPLLAVKKKSSESSSTP